MVKVVEFYDKRRAQAEELEMVRAQLELLMNLSPMGVVKWLANGELLDINDQFAAMMGYTKE